MSYDEIAAELIEKHDLFKSGIWRISYAIIVYVRATDSFQLYGDTRLQSDFSSYVMPSISFGLTPNIMQQSMYETLGGTSGINLDKLFVPRDLRYQGIGTKLMQLMVSMGEVYNQTLYLVPGYNPMMEPCLSGSQLVEWYRKLGFKLIPISGNGMGYYMRKIPRRRLDQEVTRKIGKPQMGWIK